VKMSDPAHSAHIGAQIEPVAPATPNNFISSPEALQELADGQLVVIAARWILVIAGLLLAIWNPGPIGELRLQIMVLLVIAVGNFFLHAHVLRKKETLATVAYLSSAADLTVISILIASQHGFGSNLYVFYFPAIAALALAFPREITIFLVGCGAGLYTMICLRTLPDDLAKESLQALSVRLVMMAGVAVCAALYQQVEANRRRAAEEGTKQFVPELHAPDPISIA
jgi:hypothetical protein